MQNSLSLVITYSHELESNGTTMLKLCTCFWKVEVFVWVYLRWDLSWACVYKGVEVKMVNKSAKSFLCVREKKNLETLNQIKEIVVLKHWIKNVTKIVLKHWTEGNKESLFLNLFLSLMWLKNISILFIECTTWQNLILSRMRSLFLYWNIKPNKRNSSLKTLNKKCNKNSLKTLN